MNQAPEDSEQRRAVRRLSLQAYAAMGARAEGKDVLHDWLRQHPAFTNAGHPDHGTVTAAVRNMDARRTEPLPPSRFVDAGTLKRLAGEAFTDIGEDARDPETMLEWFQKHAANRDPKHADHNAVRAIVRNTYEAKYGTKRAR